ncbi:MAG: hypothetical protein V4439_03055 [Patescibacteria group bacterium]
MDYFTFDRILVYIGILLSAGAFWQAYRSKLAAREAKQEVQLRSTEEEISDICNSCTLKKDVAWMDANNQIATINGRVKTIIGQLKTNINYKEIIDILEKDLADMGVAFNTLDDVETTSSQICFTLASPFRELIGSLQELRGRLKKESINK